MNDRFKFRVWDSVDCEYIEDSDAIRLTQYGKFVFNNAANNTEPELNPKRFIFEQCTGLKDKNGKLIYENDIVKAFGFTESYILVCRFRGSSFHVDHIDGRPYNFIHSVAPVEVIGNVHENNELLEDYDEVK